MAKKPVKKAPAKKPARTKRANNIIDVSKVEKAEHLHVQVVEEKTNDFHTALGITDERASEITKMAHLSIIETSGMARALAQGSQMCKHANELAYLVLATAEIRAKLHNPLLGMMGGR